jgi:hypothetical protein
MSHPSPPAPTIDAELTTLLRRLKLGRLLDTLPQRLALARTEHLPHADFLQLVLADEVDRRDPDLRRAARPRRQTRPRHAAGGTPHRHRHPVRPRTMARAVFAALPRPRPRSTDPRPRSGSAKPTWPPRSDTSPSAAHTPSPSPAPTTYSADSKPPDSTTPPKPRCTAWPAWTY